ncbi:MAG: hypothetical protein KC910_25395 [Candidatus Eremiobacteraeota bacterium]|nr:hypothetical protein [Candidatus Eremiobacteraeota bacterium]
MFKAIGKAIESWLAGDERSHREPTSTTFVPKSQPVPAALAPAPQATSPRPAPLERGFWPDPEMGCRELEGMLAAGQLPPHRTALVLFLLGREKAYDRLDFEGGRLLGQAYRQAPLEVRRQVLSQLRRLGRPELLAALDDSRSEGLSSDLGLDEVRTRLEMVDDQTAYRLLRQASPAAAALIVKHLMDRQFEPANAADRDFFNRLAGLCPQADGRYLPYPIMRNRHRFPQRVAGLRYNHDGRTLAVRLANGQVYRWRTFAAPELVGKCSSNALYGLGNSHDPVIAEGDSFWIGRPERRINLGEPVLKVVGGEGSRGAVAVVGKTRVLILTAQWDSWSQIELPAGDKVYFEDGYLCIDNRRWEVRTSFSKVESVPLARQKKASLLGELRVDEQRRVTCAQLCPQHELVAIARDREVSLHAVRDLASGCSLGVYDLLYDWIGEGLCEEGWERNWHFVAEVIAFQGRFEVEVSNQSEPTVEVQAADIAIEDFEQF